MTVIQATPMISNLLQGQTWQLSKLHQWLVICYACFYLTKMYFVEINQQF